MRKGLLFILVISAFSSCTTINLTVPGSDDLYWSRNDIIAEEAVPDAQPSEDYWEGDGRTYVETETGDVTVNNYDAPQSSGWASWDPYWGWGFGIGWHRPQYYMGWYNNFWCYGNNWYSPYWYNNPWGNYCGGWGHNPWNPYPNWGNSFGFNGNPYGWTNWGGGILTDNSPGSAGGIVYGPFTPISSNSAGNSSYNGQGVHLGRVMNGTAEPGLNQAGPRPKKPVNYVERIVVPETENIAENAASIRTNVGRSFMNIPPAASKPKPTGKPNYGLFSNPSGTGPGNNSGTKLPTPKPSESKPSFSPKSPQMPGSAPSPSRSSNSNSISSPSKSGGGGGGRPPRN